MLGDGDPGDSVLLFLSFNQVKWKFNLFHNLLLNPFFQTFWFPTFTLDASGGYTVPILVDNDPMLVGMVLHHQFLTYVKKLKEISNLASTVITN